MARLKSFAQATALVGLIGLGVYGVTSVTKSAYIGSVGITYGKAYAPVRDQNLDFHIWYPATDGGRAITVGGNGVFYGTPAGKGAPHAQGAYPLVVISHGAGGNAGQFGWIASALAEAGYVVVLPNHPGTTSRNASAKAAVRIWERPADITAVIDTIVENPDTYPYIDVDRIAALGFSAGGYTAMALSGARVDVERLQSYCDPAQGDHGMSDCAYLKRGGVDLHAMDLTPASQDLSDPRIRASVFIDPGIIETITEDSLMSMKTPSLVINLGDDGTVPVGVDAKAAAALIPNAQFAAVGDAIHFSFLAQCKPKGAYYLAKEGEPDPLCDDGGGRDRAEIHAELGALISEFLAAIKW